MTTTMTPFPAPVLRADAAERETVREVLRADEMAYQRMVARARSVLAGETIDYQGALFGQSDARGARFAP